MPPLYLIACLAFVVLYINERLLVCYYYREPPAFDEKMTMLTLDIVKWVPFVMLPMAFWQLGNRQIYEAVIEPIDFKTDVRLSSHTIATAAEHLNPMFMTYNSGPVWCLALIILGSWVYNRCYPDSAEEEEDDQLVEGLEDYFQALKKSDRNSLVGQEETFLRQYGVKTFSDNQFAQLKSSETVDDDKVIMGVATYRLLDSLEYQQSFQYEPARRKEDGTCARDGVITISTQEGEDVRNCVNEPAQQDATFLAVNLAYIPESKRSTFNLDTSNGKKLFS